MSKTEQIKKLIAEGKNFEQIKAQNIAKESFVKKLCTEAGVEWRTPEEQEIKESVQKLSEATKEQHPPLFEEEEFQPSEPAAQPQVVGTIDPQTLALAMQLAQQMAGQAQAPAIRVEVEKCIRHPHIDVKPGENCPECIKSSRLYEHRMSASTFVLPCPNCKNDMHTRRGGTIQFNRRKNSYSCGNCQITYTEREQTPWGKGDYHHI